MFNPDKKLNTEIEAKDDEREGQVRKKIEFRFSQSMGSKIAEYITGLTPDNPAMVERLISDQKIIREKYGLPKKELMADSNEYERFLRKTAKEYGVRIDETSNCGVFFKENSSAGGVYFEEGNRIGIDIDRSTASDHSVSVQLLEHELIHAMQNKSTPRMPVELKEYEAYIANFNLTFLRTLPNAGESMESMFNFYFGTSILFSYKEQSEKEGRKILPKWDDPLFFLKNVDELDESELAKHSKEIREMEIIKMLQENGAEVWREEKSAESTYRVKFSFDTAVVNIRIKLADLSGADLVITNITTLPETQKGRGYGSNTIKSLLSWADKSELKDIRAVQVAEHNEHFWTQNGFVKLEGENPTNDFIYRKNYENSL